jgi:hypothetical protein
MRKAITFALCLLFTASLFASQQGLFTSSRGSTYSKSCSTPTVAATELFTLSGEVDLESVTYQALSGDVYISTYAATSTTGLWKIVSGAIPQTIKSSAYRYGLSSGTVSNDLQIHIEK